VPAELPCKRSASRRAWSSDSLSDAYAGAADSGAAQSKIASTALRTNPS
jgi:hypothetical protein